MIYVINFLALVIRLSLTHCMYTIVIITLSLNRLGFPIVYLMMILYSLALFSIVTTVNTTSLQPFICANMQTYSLR